MTINVNITGSDKQVKWATDIINHPANYIKGMIEVEKRFGESHAANIEILNKTITRYTEWLTAGAASMGGELKGGWVIDHKGAFKGAANEMLNAELTAAGKEQGALGYIQ